MVQIIYGMMLYKYLFYASTFYVRKFDRLWNVGDGYYFWGTMTVGIIIAFTLTNIIDIIGLLFWHPLIVIHGPYTVLLPFIFGLLATFYIGKTKKADIIYDEIKNLPQQIKKKYKILNIFHLLITLGLYFILTDLCKSVIEKEQLWVYSPEWFNKFLKP